MYKQVTLLLTAAVLAASAAPQSNCIITEYSQIDEVVKNCNDIVVKDLTVPPNQTLTLNLTDGTRLEFQGKTSFQYFNWKGPLVSINGNYLHIRGAEDHVLYGNGEMYWDGLGGNGVVKPKFFRLLQVNNSVVENIHLKNCPVHCTSVSSCNNVTISGWNIDVSEGDKHNFTGHNTDGFGISGTNIVIKNSTVRNQDDCVVINRGSNITVSNMKCYGGHGLSISVGFSKTDFESNSAHNVLFENSLVDFSPNGIHVKTHSDAGPGILTNITYRNITLNKISNFAINIQQDYENGEATGNPGTNIPIVGLTLDGIFGYMKSYNNSPTLKDLILCGEGSCRDWSFNNILISGAANRSNCTFVPDGYSC